MRLRSAALEPPPVQAAGSPANCAVGPDCNACAKIGDGGGTTTLQTSAIDPGTMTQVADAEFQTMPLNAPAPPAISLDEDERARVTSLLADRIGPVAAALLKKEMKQAKSLTDLTAKLALAIPDETERRVFFEAMGNIS